MQIVGRACVACAAELRRIGDGDGCGACDIALCKKCLQGTARCPSCQRLLDETRDRPAVAGLAGDAEIAKGRALTLAAVGASIVAVVLLVALSDASTHLGRSIAIAFVAFGLVYQLLRGRALARWVLVISGLTIACVYYWAVTHRAVDPGVRTVVLALIGLFSSSSVVLGLVPSVSRYLRAQRLRHR